VLSVLQSTPLKGFSGTGVSSGNPALPSIDALDGLGKSDEESDGGESDGGESDGGESDGGELGSAELGSAESGSVESLSSIGTEPSARPFTIDIEPAASSSSDSLGRIKSAILSVPNSIPTRCNPSVPTARDASADGGKSVAAVSKRCIFLSSGYLTLVHSLILLSRSCDNTLSFLEFLSYSVILPTLRNFTSHSFEQAIFDD
jgi:hypothetical protein